MEAPGGGFRSRARLDVGLLRRTRVSTVTPPNGPKSERCLDTEAPGADRHAGQHRPRWTVPGRGACAVCCHLPQPRFVWAGRARPELWGFRACAGAACRSVLLLRPPTGLDPRDRSPEGLALGLSAEGPPVCARLPS